VPDMEAETFQRLMIYVYKDEAKISSMDVDLVIGVYYAGFLIIQSTSVLLNNFYIKNYKKQRNTRSLDWSNCA
jgi:orotate phosphoribosyltransferase